MSKNEMQMVRSLRNKKERNEHGLFVAEGLKAVKELLASRVKTRSVYAVRKFDDIKAPLNLVSESEFAKMSSMKTPQGILAVAEKPSHKLSVGELKNELTLALAGIRDPGNMGSIVRAADWFGIKNVVCSSDTCDIYNPKAIAAAMGSAFRVKVHYTDPLAFLSEAKNNGITVYASATDGVSIYEAKLSAQGIIIIGNESKGVPEELKSLAAVKISIPSFGEAESLNAALACAAICCEFRRRKMSRETA